MSTIQLSEFQKQVSELLLRHRSLLDVLSKYDQSNASVHRSIVKAITECGCVEVNGKKQRFAPEMTLEEAKNTLETHMSGQLCDTCLDAVSAEFGRNLFYMSSLCNLLNINLEDVIDREMKKCSTLGLFNLS